MAGKSQEHWRLSESLLSTGWAAPLAALCAYLATTPEARTGLSVRSSCEAVVRSLFTSDLRRRGFVKGPTITHRGELWNVARQVRRSYCRVFEGRTISGEPCLSPEEFAEAVRGSLPPWIDDEYRTPEAIASAVAACLAVSAWPFGVLRATAS
jgi:hypothetical protein